ncbi:sulfotransferase [Lyngbya sp. PCC 8106]|uniref:sulfotransferase family protein n=1 Tax=Lyngbya sp. (strain PCC 8106) TaxID=313612 RepID=UPI0000EAAC87|nr:sulfotransferase domain-containing protein [Lyngbya sp. PCC 8106]EAW37161.1 putative deacetylase sulfotransferase [Lyngbya sp. PCC 8106]
MVKQLVKEVIYSTYPIWKSKPDFLIIGAQRSGVTSLYHYLAQHPQALITWTWRETYYFDIHDNYNKGLGWYLKHFPSKIRKGKKLTFEAAPSYLYHQYIPLRIQQDLGNIKMIAILRNPAHRAYSAWQMFQNYSTNTDPYLREITDSRTFSEAIAQELNIHSTQPKYPYQYIEKGKYVNHLNNYYKYFDPQHILVLNFEQFCDNLSLVLDRVCDFLEIEPFSLKQIQQLKKQKYATANYVKNIGDEDVLEKLKTYFLPENQKLYELLNVRFDW